MEAEELFSEQCKAVGLLQAAVAEDQKDNYVEALLLYTRTLESLMVLFQNGLLVPPKI